MLGLRAAEWIALQHDTYRVAREEGLSYWELRRLRKLAKSFVQALKSREDERKDS